MVDNINKLPGARVQQSLEVNPRQMRPVSSPSGEASASFKEVLADAVTEVQKLQNEADTTISKLVSGELTDVTEALVAIERADVSFQTMMAVRSKVMAAYEEIMRMQI